MSALSVEALTVAFSGIRAIDDLSFSVEKGQRLVIFGPNGAGKTTLFNAISGLFSPTSGRIRLWDKDITDLAVFRRTRLGLARTFQITSLFPRMTVLDSVLLAVQASKPSQYAMHRPLRSYEPLVKKARQLLSDWDLASKADRETGTLAYGEQRQVELVIALASEPKVLLLDEPAAGLSVAETAVVERMIGAFPRDMTVLLIEHDIDMALALADRVMVLQNGRFVTSGSPDQVRRDQRVADIYFGAGHE